MVGFAKVHHPSNCLTLTLNNRNRFDDDGHVAAQTTDSMPLGTSDRGNDDIIDSVRYDVNRVNNCWHKPKRRSRRCATIDKKATVKSNKSRCASVEIYHGIASGSRKRSIQGAGMWFYVQTTVKSCNLSVSIIFCAAISLLLLNIDVINAEPQQSATEQQCEPKVLEETPPDPVSIQFVIIRYSTVLDRAPTVFNVFFFFFFCYLHCCGFDFFRFIFPLCRANKFYGEFQRLWIVYLCVYVLVHCHYV